MGIRHDMDEARRRVVVTLDDGTTGAEAADFIVGLVGARPELRGWDWINDVRGTDGEAHASDVTRVAAAFAGGGAAPAYTVFVSHSSMLPLWAKTMDHQFVGRTHLTAPTLEAAHRLIDKRRGS